MEMIEITDFLYKPVRLDGCQLGILLDIRTTETDVEIWYLVELGVCCEIMLPGQVSELKKSEQKIDGVFLARSLGALVGRAASAAGSPEVHLIEKRYLDMVVATLPNLLEANDISIWDLEKEIVGRLG